MERLFRILLFALTLAAVATPPLAAQIVVPGSDREVNTDSIRRAFDDGPYFGLYKDNYFVFGPPVGQKITKENTNIKFQISVAQRLTRSVLPLSLIHI